MINGSVSHWWEQIGVPTPRPGLPGDLNVDVAIVGAGYTGLWTAYYLKRAQPDLRVAVIEQRYVGYGASGRNGGWLTNAITGGREQYVSTHGRDAAERFQRAMNHTVDEVIRVADDEGIDADILKGGEFNVAYTPAQETRIRQFAADEQSWRYTDLELLEAPEAIEKINVAATRAAVWHPHSARIQPAKLAQGLARAVERLGVKIHEGTRVSEILPHRLITDRGEVRAEFIVRATEGFTSGLKGLKREWLPMNSSMIATEPLSAQVWDELRWNQGETLGDWAHVTCMPNAPLTTESRSVAVVSLTNMGHGRTSTGTHQWRRSRRSAKFSIDSFLPREGPKSITCGRVCSVCRVTGRRRLGWTAERESPGVVATWVLESHRRTSPVARSRISSSVTTLRSRVCHGSITGCGSGNPSR